MSKNDVLSLSPQAILDSVNDGIYVVDTDRRIVYWSKSAERITGWQAADIVGKRCCDALLCHEDKDGRRLCGEEHCPLHRAMVTNQSSTRPKSVARTKSALLISLRALLQCLRLPVPKAPLK